MQTSAAQYEARRNMLGRRLGSATSHPVALLAALWLAALAFLLAPASLWAGTGDVMTSPMMGVKPKSKLLLTVDPVWVEGNGYRPVRIELGNMPPAPSITERNFTLEVSPRNWYTHNDQTTVTGSLTIPAGKAAGEATISVPYSGMWNAIQVEVFEDGSRLKDMALNANFNSPNGNNNWHEMVPTFLIIDKDAPTRSRRAQLKQVNYFSGPGNTRPVSTYDLPDYRLLSALNPYGNVYYGGQQADDLTLLQSLYGLPNVELLPPEEISERWLDLSCFDVAFISLTEMRSLATQHPKRFAALSDWVAAGSTLCVFGAGKKFERLGEVEELLGMLPPDPASKSNPGRGWVTPKTQSFNQNFRFDLGGSYGYAPGAVTYAVPAPGMPMTAMAPTPPPGFMVDQNGQVVPIPQGSVPANLPELRIRQHQMGRVMVASPDDLFPGTAHQWSWICQSIGLNNLMWYQRHGMSLTTDNNDYWNFLIPGVGMAPVTGFRVLISLFVVLIGPVNYLLLRRWRRLYLLLVTVPAGAAVVTFCLLGYALVTDGLGVRARLRSYTHINQRTGSAVSWSRQSYYAGLAPSSGMTFPDDTAVYRILDRRFDSGPLSKRLTWLERRQNLRSGYINSRITSQFLVVRAHHKTPARVAIAETAGSPPQVENLLGTKIHQLALCDSQGKWYWAEDVAAGETVRPKERTAVESFGKLRKVFAANQLTEPAGFSPNSYNYYGPRWGRGRYNYYNNSQGRAPPTTISSLLEAELRVAATGGTAPLPPRSYLAVVEQSPEVPLGVASARQEASLHVVVGQW